LTRRTFISEPIEPAAPSGTDLPRAFAWRNETLDVRTVRRTWRGTKEDRGDVYLKRHWYEFETADGRASQPCTSIAAPSRARIAGGCTR
jgi:hypothetical protein